MYRRAVYKYTLQISILLAYKLVLHRLVCIYEFPNNFAFDKCFISIA